MIINVETNHVFTELPPEAKPEDILLIGETHEGNLIIDYKGKQYISNESDCIDVVFTKG